MISLYPMYYSKFDQVISSSVPSESPIQDYSLLVLNNQSSKAVLTYIGTEIAELLISLYGYMNLNRLR